MNLPAASPRSAAFQHIQASVRESEINKSQFCLRKARSFPENTKPLHAKLQYKVDRHLGTQGGILSSWQCHLEENRTEVCGLGHGVGE